ncbi:M16 family metallopeptidase [Orenia marismortui]|uniref:Zinc protease n=1 Tax=Orenia marismortui TaxID=46469 RepID=A0A4V3GYH6_9FIRM|nr:pitrilysin family protein [Orenia marismortui]TDX52745.1 zinc protease [Orenia marismortui]
MKKIILSSILLLVIFQCIFLETSYAKVDFDQELFKSLAQNKNKVPKIKIHNYKRVELENGMVVYLIEDHKLPIIEINAYIKGGRRQENREFAGISEFMLEMMNTGTKNFNEQQFYNFKEVNGIDFNFEANNDYLSVSANSLSVDKEELIFLLAEVLKTPKFDRSYFKRIKQETYRALTQAKMQEDALLDMYYYKEVYNNHPYSFTYNVDLRLKALNNISPKSLKKFYNSNIAPNNTILGIVGDIDVDKMEEILKLYFNSWQKKDIKIKEVEVKSNSDNYGEVILVNKSDATQAKIKMGYNFFNNDFKDKVPFTIANRIYGGGDFSSRLMKNLRIDKGYVYGIYAHDSYSQLGGDYYITTEVKADKVYQTMQEIKKEMLAIKEGKRKIKKGELFEIVNLYNAFYPKAYSSKLKVLNQLMYNVEIMNREVDYINDFIEEYNSLSQKEVQKVFSKYSYPNKFITVIVGRKEEILPIFKDKDIDIKVIESN